MHADDAPSRPLSFSCVEAYGSMLVDLYRTHTLQLDAAMDAELKNLLEGYEKTTNELKRRGLMDINEGKRHLKSSGYDLLAKLMKQTPSGIGQSWSTAVFASSFFVLMWNLMSRSDPIDKIMLQHIDWSKDALIVEEQGQKVTRQAPTSMASMCTQTRTSRVSVRSLLLPFCYSAFPIVWMAIINYSSARTTRGDLVVPSESDIPTQ
jgi:hypothetical protein